MLGFVGQVPRASDPAQKEPSERGCVTSASILFQVKKSTKSRKNKLIKEKLLRYNCSKSICKNHLQYVCSDFSPN